MKTDVVIIGAGLTGMTTAFYLQQAGFKVTLLEKADRAGGVINSRTEGEFTYETGPNAGVLSHKKAWELFEALQDEECQVEFAPKSSAMRRYVSKNRKWHPLPMSPKSLITTPLFSLKDKVGLLFEPLRRRGKNPHESLADFTKRRLGKSILNYAIDPFILGVYAGDPSKLSVKHAFPKLYDLEQVHGSLIKGMVKRRKNSDVNEKFPNKGQLFSFKGGMVRMVEALERRIGRENFYFNVGDINVKALKNGRYEVHGVHEEKQIIFETPRVVTACGAFSLPEILPFVDKNQLKLLNNCEYTDVVEVSLGFNDWHGRDLDGFGGLCPHIENHEILGVLFISATMSNRAPDNGAMLAVFLGGTRNRHVFDKNDEEIVEILSREIPELMELPGFSPDLIRIHRHKWAIPQYGVESAERFLAVDVIEKSHPGLKLGGDFIEGIGLSKRIAHGAKIAHEIILKSKV